jgi:hypothetical protein
MRSVHSSGSPAARSSARSRSRLVGRWDSLKMSTKRGLEPECPSNPPDGQLRHPVARANDRVDQWVTSLGRLQRHDQHRSTCSVVIVRAAPRAGLTSQALQPAGHNRERYLVSDTLAA